MKKAITLIIAALLGIFAIFIFNSSEISKLGYGFELPFGWQSPPTAVYRNCTPEEQLNDPVTNNCEPVCTLQARYDTGLPFSTSRPSGISICSADSNTTASALNYLMGGTLGIIVGLLILKLSHNMDTK